MGRPTWSSPRRRPLARSPRSTASRPMPRQSGGQRRPHPASAARGGESGEAAARLWFGGEIGFAGFEVDRHRDVLVNDEPAAVRFLIDVGHPHRQVELLALLVGAGYVLNAVAIGEVAIGDDVEIGQLDGDRAIEAAEKVLPVLAVGRGADILPRRDYIENPPRLGGC